jgi:uncharacterized repeat protein (TIGR04076 family)
MKVNLFLIIVSVSTLVVPPLFAENSVGFRFGFNYLTGDREDEFISDNFLEMPQGFCGWAWGDIHKILVTFYKGGDFVLTKEDNKMITCCTDGIRPVIFEIERITD